MKCESAPVLSVRPNAHMKRPVPDRPAHLSTLSDNSVLDLAVDGAELAVQHLLGLVGNAAEAVLDVLQNGRASLVAAVGEDLGVVGRATTVPGKELKHHQYWSYGGSYVKALTLGVSEGMSVRAPEVATVIKASLSFLGVISSTA